MDRERTRKTYPNFDYTQIYLIHGGYRRFHTHYPQLCTPSTYVHMEDERFTKELTHFDSIFRSERDSACHCLLLRTSTEPVVRRPGLARSASFRQQQEEQLRRSGSAHAHLESGKTDSERTEAAIAALPRPDVEVMMMGNAARSKGKGASRLVRQFSRLGSELANDESVEDEESSFELSFDDTDVEASPLRPVMPRRVTKGQ